VVVVVPAVMAELLHAELDGANVTLPSPQLTDLVSSRSERIVSRIDRLTLLQKGKVPVARSAVICEGAQTGVAGPITRLEHHRASSQVAN
jgi:hypothetical protein